MPYLLSILLFAFTLYCLLDVAMTDEGGMRNLPKIVWVLVVVLVPVVGGILWLLGGRPNAPADRGGRGRGRPGSRGGGAHPRRPTGPSGRGPARDPRPRGPDDDPDFLRRLDERLRRNDDDR